MRQLLLSVRERIVVDHDREPARLRWIGALGLLATGLVVIGGSLAGAADPSGGGRLWSVPSVPVRPAMSLVPALGIYFAGLIIMVRAWLLLRRYHLRHGLTIVAVVTIVGLWSVPFLVGPPLGSRDVYAYAAQGRLAEQGYDVYRSGPSELGSDDPLLAPVDPVYHDAPSVYGPLFVAVSSGIASIVDDHVINAVLAFRLLAVLGLIASGFAVYDLSRGFGRDPIDALVLATANPLVLLHLVSGAHNEALMLGFLLLGVAAARRGRVHLGVALCTVAAAVKLPAILAVAFLGWSWALLAKRWSSRLARVALVAAESVAIMACLGWLTGLGWGWAYPLRTNEPVDAYLSITRLLGGTVAVFTGLDSATVLSTVRLAGIALAAGVTALLVLRRHKSWPTALAWSLLIAAVLHPTTQPWYLTWGIVLLAATAAGERNRGLVTACAASVFLVLPMGPDLGWVVVDDLRPLSLVAATAVLLILTFSPGEVHSERARTGLDPRRASIVVPTRHEGPNIAPLVAHIEKAMKTEAWPASLATAEIVFVDDSDDQTPVVIEVLARSRPRDAALKVRMLHRHPQQRWGGLGGAVVDAFGVVEGRSVVVMDGDLQHPANKVPELLARLEGTVAGDGPDPAKGVTIAIASRRASGGSFGEGLSASRRRISLTLALLARGLFPRRLGSVSDPLSGFFAVRLDRLDINRLQPDGFKILVEILASHRNLPVAEVPFEFTGRVQGMSKASAAEGTRYLGHLVDLRLRTSRLWAGAALDRPIEAGSATTASG